MTVPTGYLLTRQAPSIDDYRRLRVSAGLSAKTEEQAERALSGSWTLTTVRSELDGAVVAMGRVVGDGGWYFVIADMATAPSHQRRGLGGAVLDDLLAVVREQAPAGAYVTLTADPPGEALYRSRGFRETAPVGTGMHLPLTADDDLPGCEAASGASGS